MQTFEVGELEKRGNEAVRKLRRSKHDKGLPFMINSKGLPKDQCYLEYPDGTIRLVTIKSPNDRDFTVIRELSAIEASEVRSRFLLA